MAWEQPEFWHCGASERSPVYLDSSAFALLTIFFFIYIFLFFGRPTRHLCVCTVQDYCACVFYFIFSPSICFQSLPKEKQPLSSCSMVSLHIHTWVNPNNGLMGGWGGGCKRVPKSTRKHFKIKCSGHIMSICWSINNCCKWKESDNLERTSEGWWSGRKLGLIAEGRLTEHLSPSLSSSTKGVDNFCRSPSYNNEFSWYADMPLNIH